MKVWGAVLEDVDSGTVYCDIVSNYRAGMLLSHINVEAQKQLIGLENEYVRAIEMLDRYYGDKHKVVQALPRSKVCSKFNHLITRIVVSEYLFGE